MRSRSDRLASMCQCLFPCHSSAGALPRDRFLAIITFMVICLSLCSRNVRCARTIFTMNMCLYLHISVLGSILQVHQCHGDLIVSMPLSLPVLVCLRACVPSSAIFCSRDCFRTITVPEVYLCARVHVCAFLQNESGTFRVQEKWVCTCIRPCVRACARR